MESNADIIREAMLDRKALLVAIYSAYLTDLDLEDDETEDEGEEV